MIVARVLWDALCGGLLAVGLLRLTFAMGAASAPDLGSGRTEAAGFMPELFGEFYVTGDQLMLMQVMAAAVIVLAGVWAIARVFERPAATAP